MVWAKVCKLVSRSVSLVSRVISMLVFSLEMAI